MILQLARHVAATAVDELRRIASDGSKVFDARFIVDMTEGMEPGFDPPQYMPLQRLRTDVYRLACIHVTGNIQNPLRRPMRYKYVDAV